MKLSFNKKNSGYFNKFFLPYLWYNWIFYILYIIFDLFLVYYPYGSHKEQYEFFINFNIIFSATFFDYDFYFLIFNASDLDFILGYQLSNFLSTIPVLNICFAILFLIALISYTVSQKKSSKLLTFCISIITFCLIIKIFKAIFGYTYFTNITSMVFFVKYFIGNSLLLFFYFKLLRYLLSEFHLKSVDLNGKSNSEVVTGELQKERLSDKEQLENYAIHNQKKHRNDLEEAGMFSRFLHFILDNFLLIICFSTVLEFFILRYQPKFESDFIFFIIEFLKKDYSLYMIFFIWRLLYYLFFESIFKITPAKILTSNRVVSSYIDSPIRFIQIIGRTCFRYIPFNALSFLFKGNWHDRLSSTQVVKVEKC